MPSNLINHDFTAVVLNLSTTPHLSICPLFQDP